MKSSIALFALPLLWLGCSSPQLLVDHQQPTGQSLSDYDSYHLVVTPPEEANRKHWMIEKAIHDDLRAKGYRPVDRQSADVVVTYDVEVNEEKAERQDATATNAAPPPSGEAGKKLVVTAQEADDGTLIWRGQSLGQAPPDRMTSTLMEAMEHILDGVPVSAGARASAAPARPVAPQ